MIFGVHEILLLFEQEISFLVRPSDAHHEISVCLCVIV